MILKIELSDPAKGTITVTENDITVQVVFQGVNENIPGRYGPNALTDSDALLLRYSSYAFPDDDGWDEEN